MVSNGKGNAKSNQTIQRELIKKFLDLSEKSVLFSDDTNKGLDDVKVELKDVVDLDNIGNFYDEVSKIFYALLPRINGDRVEFPEKDLHKDYKNDKKESYYKKTYYVGRDISYRCGNTEYGNGVVLKGKDLFEFVRDNDITLALKGNVISVLERKKKIINEFRDIIKDKDFTKDKDYNSYYRERNKHIEIITPKDLKIINDDYDRENKDELNLFKDFKIEKLKLLDNGAVSFYVKDVNVDKDDYNYDKEIGDYREVFNIHLYDSEIKERQLKELNFKKVLEVCVLKDFETDIKNGFKKLIDEISISVTERKSVMDALKQNFSARLTIAKI